MQPPRMATRTRYLDRSRETGGASAAHEETTDWVKLESEASSEPPRHQATTLCRSKAPRTLPCRSNAASRGKHTLGSRRSESQERADLTRLGRASLNRRQAAEREVRRPPKRSTSCQSRCPRSRPHRSADNARRPKPPHRVMQHESASRNAMMGLLLSSVGERAQPLHRGEGRTRWLAIPEPQPPSSGFYSTDESVLRCFRCRWQHRLSFHGLCSPPR
jgi:hypothetical protein